MNKISIVIVEDEIIAAKNLEKQILKLEPDFDILAILTSVRQSVEWFSSNTADLVFMDIQLGDGQSFKIFERVELSSPVIFTTAYDQYAIRAFKANGIDYLLKPVDTEELRNALMKFRNLVYQKPDLTFIRELLLKSGMVPEYKQRFMIQAGSRIRSIPVETIAYFYFLEKAVFICTADNHRFPAEYSLDKLEEMVDPAVFFRINRRFLVSIKFIDKIYSLTKSRIKLELKPPFEEEVLVSYNKSPAFREWLNK
jgi:two-component system, LytTR family, response regulator LytT